MPPTIITKESLYKRITELERKHCCGKNQFFDSFEDFPAEGQKGILYIDESTGDIYVWVVDAFVLAGDKFHSNIVGTGAYDAGLPLTNWTPPSGAIDGNTAQVKFTDGVVVNYTYNGTTWVVDFVDDAAVSGAGVASKVAFWTDANTLDSDTDLHWDDVNKRLGIGTTTPSLKFNVQSSSPVCLFHRVASDGSGPYTVGRFLANYSGGDMVDNFGGTLVFQIQDNAGIANEIANFGAVRSGADNSGALIIRTRYNGGEVTEKFRVDPLGNVGIGATAPLSKLHLSGSSSSAAIIVTDTDASVDSESWAIQSLNSGGNAQLRFRAINDTYTNGINSLVISRSGIASVTSYFENGNVGIGTTSPAKLLDVNGDALVNGLTVGRGAGNISTNTAFGPLALASNTTGGNNVAIGPNALLNNTTGDLNVAIGGREQSINGWGAMQSNTTGFHNTAVGAGTLASNTSASYNSAFGYMALFANTTGANNTASGYQALYSNTTGYDNTATGSVALYSNTTGYNNTAVGKSALQNNTTGDSNTAVGPLALRNNTTGYNNSAFNYALQTNSTGHSNTAIGREALIDNTTGSLNSAVGIAALARITTGSDNTGVGNESGVFISDGVTSNTTPSNSVYIGSASKALADNQTNQIVIGHTAIGGGSNTATIGNSSVTVLYLAGSVGWFQGNGTPEGAVAAPVGSFYSRKDGGANTSFYVKESGSGNTGWIGK
jgi:hypothetical protein